MMNNEFPKMIYKNGANCVVKTEAELAQLLGEGWSLSPDGKASDAPSGLVTIEQAREKVTFYMDKFEKWNRILKDLEAASFNVEGPGTKDVEIGHDTFIIDGQISNAAAKQGESAARPAPAPKRTAVKKLARKPAKKAPKKAPEKPAAAPEAAPEG